MITTTLAKFETRINNFPVRVFLEHNDFDGFHVIYGSTGNLLFDCKNMSLSKAKNAFRKIRGRYKTQAKKTGFTETFTDYYFSPEKIQS